MERVRTLGRWKLLALAAVVAALAGYAVFPRSPSPSDLGRRVGAAYGDAQPQIVTVHPDLTEGFTHQKMYMIRIQGSFHRGDLQAHEITFSALANGHDIWSIHAVTASGTFAWQDDHLPTPAR